MLRLAFSALRRRPVVRAAPVISGWSMIRQSSSGYHHLPGSESKQRHDWRMRRNDSSVEVSGRQSVTGAAQVRQDEKHAGEWTRSHLPPPPVHASHIDQMFVPRAVWEALDMEEEQGWATDSSAVTGDPHGVFQPDQQKCGSYALRGGWRPIRNVLVVRKLTALELAQMQEQEQQDGATKTTPSNDAASLHSLISLHEELSGDFSGSESSASDERVQDANREHQATVRVVSEALSTRYPHLNVKYCTKLKGDGEAVVTPRHLSEEGDVEWADMVVTVGGDGSFLRAASRTQENDETVLLGVNSAPSSSVGFFTAANRDNFTRVMDNVLSHNLQQLSGAPEGMGGLWRMRIFINGEPQPQLALNDVLFCNELPSHTTRYHLLHGEEAQTQKSSGVWISTAAGSTGGILSSGGQRQRLDDRRLQFRVRELGPCDTPIRGGMIPARECWSDVDQDWENEVSFSDISTPSSQERKQYQQDDTSVHTHTQKTVSEDSSSTNCAPFALICRMNNGCLYPDGTTTPIRVQYGDVITFEASGAPLVAVMPEEQHTNATQVR